MTHARTTDTLLTRGAPGAGAIVSRDGAATYAQLTAMADAVAGRLAAEGVGAGDRVAVYAPKSVAMVAALFGAWRAGAVAVPINPLLRAEQVRHILADSGARLLLTPRARADALIEADALGGARVVELERAGEGRHTPPTSAHGPEDLAALLYTSGSTGRPKGVMLSHANLWFAADSVATYLGLGVNDVALAVLPLSFDAGLSVITSAMMAGGSAALLDYLVPRDVVKAVGRFGATTLSGVPPLFVQLADVDWGDAGATLRRITVTGGRMPVSMTRRLRATFPDARVYLMYGLTEAFRSLYLAPELVDAHPDSVGGPIPHARVAVLRSDGSVAGDGEAGELVHAGPLVARGYWGDAEATAARFRPAPAALGGGMAVWSGDTVRREADGLHYFVGRDDEMIKTSGLRVSPTDVEEAAFATGAVGEAAAFGVADAALGQVIALVAVAAGEDAAARLVRGLAESLPAYMRPARVEWRSALPRSANGKIDRVALRIELGA